MVRRSTFLSGEQVMRSRYGEKVKLPTWRDMLRRSTFLPGKQIMQNRDDEMVNFLPGELVMEVFLVRRSTSYLASRL